MKKSHIIILLTSLFVLGISTINARIVIIEEFTGTWCPYCYAAGMALDQLEAQYQRDQVLIISYHMEDDYSIAYNSPREDYYNISGYPTAVFNGVYSEVGGEDISQGEAGISMMYSVYTNDLKSEQNR